MEELRAGHTRQGWAVPSENCMGERLFGRWKESPQVEKYLSDKSHVSKTYEEFSEVNRKTIQF